MKSLQVIAVWPSIAFLIFFVNCNMCKVPANPFSFASPSSAMLQRYMPYETEAHSAAAPQSAHFRSATWEKKFSASLVVAPHFKSPSALLLQNSQIPPKTSWSLSITWPPWLGMNCRSVSAVLTAASMLTWRWSKSWFENVRDFETVLREFKIVQRKGRVGTRRLYCSGTFHVVLAHLWAPSENLCIHFLLVSVNAFLLGPQMDVSLGVCTSFEPSFTCCTVLTFQRFLNDISEGSIAGIAHWTCHVFFPFWTFHVCTWSLPFPLFRSSSFCTISCPTRPSTRWSSACAARQVYHNRQRLKTNVPVPIPRSLRIFCEKIKHAVSFWTLLTLPPAPWLWAPVDLVPLHLSYTSFQRPSKHHQTFQQSSTCRPHVAFHLCTVCCGTEPLSLLAMRQLSIKCNTRADDKLWMPSQTQRILRKI